MTSAASPVAPPPPRVRVSVGITGHRATHAAYPANAARIEAVLTSVFDLIDAVVARTKPPFTGGFAPVRLHSMLADGADQAAARLAQARGWELVAPLPFGEALNAAINAAPLHAADARALLTGSQPADEAVAARAEAIRSLSAQAQVFALADRDEEISDAFLTTLESPGAAAARDVFNADCAERVALAARLVVEQSDILVAVWDGARTTFVGGTGHTLATALDLGANVVWIDPARPEAWRILAAPEALADLQSADRGADQPALLARLVEAALGVESPAPPTRGHHASDDGEPLSAATWRPHSNPLWHAYRRVEAVFGGESGKDPWRSLRQTYETPNAYLSGSGAGTLATLRTLPGIDLDFAERTAGAVLARFAWADGVSAHLSDTYRGGMIINFALSALAVVGGLAYLPFVDTAWKWPFALAEFALLVAILAITFVGQKRRWHGRWFETRRAAEYLRHAPLLLALGAARAPGLWPRGVETSWPEQYARQALREVGLPCASVTRAYLRTALTGLLDAHVTAQRDYHHAKAKKLAAVHRNLDEVSTRLFQAAVVSVGLYLILAIVGGRHLIDYAVYKDASKVFTFLGVALPTFGAGIAGARYFGDFERFAAISEVTAGKLDAVHDRIQILVAAPEAALTYGAVAELAHAADQIVASEIENWQAVFGGKHITVPV
ncbi:MAG: hypothetical protein ACOYM8_12795 [Caulobacterales bacterium]|jgi:hypothetical protein